MAANSAGRRLLKSVLAPVLNEGTYRYIQAMVMAWDIRRGSFTEPEVDLIPLAVRPGETVLDLGANYGLYTYHLSRAVGRSGRVFAFEPVPFTFGTLSLVSKILGIRNAELVPKGCGERGGELSFMVPVQSSGAPMSGLAHISSRNDDRQGKETQVRWKQTREVRCEVVALDEFLLDLKNLSLIKCDIEGAELFAFRGAEKHIDRHHPSVICEINPWYLEGFGQSTENLTEFFAAKGYRLFSYDVEHHRLIPVGSPAMVVEDNYFFVHQDRMDRMAPLLAPEA